MLRGLHGQPASIAVAGAGRARRHRCLRCHPDRVAITYHGWPPVRIPGADRWPSPSRRRLWVAERCRDESGRRSIAGGLRPQPLVDPARHRQGRDPPHGRVDPGGRAELMRGTRRASACCRSSPGGRSPGGSTTRGRIAGRKSGFPLVRAAPCYTPRPATAAASRGGSLSGRPWAGVAELADAPDLGSGDASRGGSSPSARTRTPAAGRRAGDLNPEGHRLLDRIDDPCRSPKPTPTA